MFVDSVTSRAGVSSSNDSAADRRTPRRSHVNGKIQRDYRGFAAPRYSDIGGRGFHILNTVDTAFPVMQAIVFQVTPLAKSIATSHRLRQFVLRRRLHVALDLCLQICQCCTVIAGSISPAGVEENMPWQIPLKSRSPAFDGRRHVHVAYVAGLAMAESSSGGRHSPGRCPLGQSTQLQRSLSERCPSRHVDSEEPAMFSQVASSQTAQS